MEKRENRDESKKRQAVADDLVCLWLSCAEGGGDREWSRLLERLDGLVRFYLREKLYALEGRFALETVEDLAQEVYCRLIDRGRRALRRCRAQCEAQIFAYLKSIVAAVVIDRYRTRKALKRAVSLGPHRERQPSLRAEIRHSDGLSPEERLLVTELRSLLRRKIVAVCDPSRVRRDGWIFERAVLEGWTSREISAHVDLAPSSVDSLVHRIRRRLGAAGLVVPERC